MRTRLRRFKYFYNSHTLKYEKVEISFGRKILHILSYLLTGVLFSIATLYFSFHYINSPKEESLKQDIKTLSFQYEILLKRIRQVDIVLDDLQERDNNIYRILFEADPVNTEESINAFSGIQRYRDIEGSNYSTLMINATKQIDNLTKKLYAQSKSYDYLIKEVRNKSAQLASFPAIQPISNKDLTRMASGYGYRIHPIYKTTKMHAGMDFTAPVGTEIYATGDGKVVKAGEERGYGRAVLINHGYGYETLYAHMNKIFVKKDAKVKRGEVIGVVGNTGMSTGPHLHYEVRKNKKPVNPINFYFNDLSPEEYERMLQMSSNINQSFD